ncbi:MAG: hypothetical protein K9J12_13475 [Melioribacteraceae bacterium]|nr:hypothetical protein [Melioribacteraceae bacterium]
MTNNNISKIHDLRFPFTRLLLLLFTFSFLLVSCDTTEPGNNGVLTLTALDASCTEVWLKVETEPNLIGTELTLFRDKQEYGSFTLAETDTVLFSDGLIPSTNYSFFAQINGIPSNTVNITTMDTTSHDFNWQTFTFGEPATSELWDVAIVHENDIWAVGEIYENGEKYNAVHWDGSEWELRKILFYTFCNQSHQAPYPARAIFDFEDRTIAITSGSQIAYLENGVQKRTECIPVSVNAMWGESSDDFYVVGNGGNIAHYQNGYWTKIESGTTENISSIWYKLDEEIQQASIFYTIPSENRLLRIKNGTIIDNTGWDQNLSPRSIYGIGSESIFAVGERGVYEQKGNGWKHEESAGEYYLTSIAANNLNDIVSCGLSGAVIHFNGKNWNTFSALQSPSLWLRKVKIFNNTIVSVGIDALYGVILVGRRN